MPDNLYLRSYNSQNKGLWSKISAQDPNRNAKPTYRFVPVQGPPFNSFKQTVYKQAMNQLFSLLNPSLLIRALSNSLNGLLQAAKTERAFQQEIVLLVIGVFAAILLTEDAVERAILIGSLGLILIVELLNSAIESAIDRIGPELNPLSKRAKDLGSAAVLISLATAVAMWIIILV